MEMMLAENIRAFRKQRSLTQEQLAEALGVTAGAVYKWEAKLSVPELPLIVEIADFFDTSVNALLGFKIKDNSLAAIADRLHSYCRNSDPAALSEAEKALKKYPNSFTIVHGCAKIYNLFGSEGHNKDYLCRALELYEHALLLISQNTSTYISEYTIYGDIGGIYVLMGEPEKGLDILKKHNTGGMFSDAISETLTVMLHQPEEAEPFLLDVLLKTACNLQSAAIGYAFLFSGRGDYAAEREIVSWALETLRGLRKDDGASYLDRTIAILLILLSHAQVHSGNAEEAGTSLRKAAALSRTFDAEPYYGVASLRYATGSETGSVHDGLGGTAGESIAYLLERLQDRELASLWKAAMDDIAESGSTLTGGNI